jgi:dUTP pyrophosphatase
MPHQPELEYFGHHEAPYYATHGAAGFDLTANIDAPLDLLPGYRALVATGLRVKLPNSYELQVRPRSGLALKHGVTVLNAPGTVDSDYYPNEIGVLLINLGQQLYTVQPGERIAQAVIARFVHLAELATESTQTRAGGFGSTNK